MSVGNGDPRGMVLQPVLGEEDVNCRSPREDELYRDLAHLPSRNQGGD